VRRTRFVLIIPALAWALASCGGSAPSNLLFSPVDGGEPFDVAARDQGLPPDTGLPPVRDAAEEDIGAAPDSTTPGPMPEAAAPEAAVIEAGPPSYSVDCGGTTTCTIPAQLCCVSGFGPQSDSCVPSASGCNAPMSTPVSCTSSAQCPAGEICCGRQPNGAYTDVTCRATCDNGNSEVVFCDPTVPNDCPQGTTCGPSQVLDGFNRCN